MGEQSFIKYIRETQPLLWQSVKMAANEGLIVIDEKNDGICATNRLLVTYPGLHKVLQRIINSWAEDRFIPSFDVSQLNNLLKR